MIQLDFKRSFIKSIVSKYCVLFPDEMEVLKRLSKIDLAGLRI